MALVLDTTFHLSGDSVLPEFFSLPMKPLKLLGDVGMDPYIVMITSIKPMVLDTFSNMCLFSLL